MIVSGRSPAKINLFLHVTGRREDGFHELFSLMTCLDLCDHISIEMDAGSEIRVVCDHPMVPEDASNLVHRAADRFYRELDMIAGEEKGGRGLVITIDKIIPVGAGLGGGSSNAATVLRLLNRHHGNPVPEARLVEIGLGLGADVPFFLHGGPAFAEGIGEKLSPCPPLVPYHVLLYYPGVHASTPHVYKNVDLALTNLQKSNNNALLKLCGAGRELDVRGLLHNDLEESACRLYPLIGSAKEKMTGFLSEGTLMTGSGSSFFALFKDRSRAERVFLELSGSEGIAGKSIFLTSFARSGKLLSGVRNVDNGASSSGKTQDFDSCIQRFESSRPSQNNQTNDW